MRLKRTTDIIFSMGGLILLAPLFLLSAIMVYFSSPGKLFYCQTRIGRHGKPFTLYKFRTMRPDAEQQGQLSLGRADARIHQAGRWLRRYKLDELPQLFNVLKGDMSIVGPRPEVPRYVALYTEEERKVLNLKPGLTDYASLHYIDEGELLAKSPDPEKTYIEDILPHKLELGLKYVEESGFAVDMRIIWLTMIRLFR